MPQELLYCRQVTPFSAQTQVKLHGVFQLPQQIVASFAWQNLSGPQFGANYSVNNSQIQWVNAAPGRVLSGGVTNVTIPLVAPQTQFEDRITRLDLRLSKVVQVSRVRVQVNLDAYNALNANSVRQVIAAYGTRYKTPAQILDARLIQIGGQISF